MKDLTAYPVYEIADRINLILKERNRLVVTAPPGTGKSTVLPLTILGGLDTPGKIIMLEPRRLAARQVAERMAWLSGEKSGDTVGYRVRFENRISEKTRIEVITEGILSRMLLDDPTLDGVSVLIFDEFHERSLASDEALAFALESQRLVRPDLRIVIMSATIDAEAVCAALSCPLLDCRGNLFPVDVRYSARDTSSETCSEDVAREVLRIHRQEKGDILAFLPGESEIRRCAALLEGELGVTGVFPLYGMLSLEEQNRAIAPSREGERKVVLATSIAETSLTIEGVRIVVDSGLYRTKVFDPQNCNSHLETVRTSRDMAEQRAGRAGRVAPGICLRLYREQTFREMKENRIPEILEADLVPLTLDIAVWGCDDACSLPWVTPPPAWKISGSRHVLETLGALDGSGKLTPEGRKLSSFPCHPRLARMMLLASGSSSRASLAADLAAILDDRDPLPSGEYGTDISLRVAFLRKFRREGNASGRWLRLIRAAEQYRRMMKAEEDDSSPEPYADGFLLAAAFPERVGKLKPEGCGRFLLAGGESVHIDETDPLSVSDYIVAVSANIQSGICGKVFLAAGTRKSDLSALCDVIDRIAWDPREDAVVARKEWRLGMLLLESKPLHDVERGRIVNVICEAAVKYGAGMFDFSEHVQNLQRRVAAVSFRHPELNLPDLSVAAVLERSSEWLPLFIGNALKVSELKKIDMEQVLWSLLDYDQKKEVELLAPSHIKVPSGSMIRVEYRQGADAPIVRVRLQECFGLAETPRVDNGRLPVIMELLSPGFKPVQLTSDLSSFWKETYFEVRKELRRRYPRHSWPDNPLEADAVRGVRKK